MMFVPCSLVGLLIPRIVLRSFPLSQDVSALKSSEEVQVLILTLLTIKCST